MNRVSRYAKALAALGHESRLDLFRLLVRAGSAGMSVGQISETLALHPSTLAHHLSMLVQADLVVQSREGRTVICRAHYAQMNQLIGYLTENCCAGVVSGKATPLMKEQADV